MMGKVLRFEVHLNNPTGIYHPGDVVSGQVSLKVAKDIPIYGKFKDTLNNMFFFSIYV